MTTWTRETLRAWLLELADRDNPASRPKLTDAKTRAALSRALLFLYDRQTSDEQATGNTSHSNGRGFSGCDAEFLSSVARSAQKYGNISAGQAPYVAKKLAKYTGQLMELVNTTAAADTPAVAA